MKAPPLLHRREVWLPTIWGWLLLLVAGAAIAVSVVRGLYSLLAINEPVGAPVLVVEGWMGPEELAEALAAFRSGSYARIVTTGGPIHRWPQTSQEETYARQAADYFLQRGVPATSVTAVPSSMTPEDRTFHSAVRVREWAERTGIRLDALDVISQGPHARRSRLLYQLAFGPEVRIGVLATRSYDYDAERWWRSSAGARDVSEQAMGVLWVKWFFRPPGRGPDFGT